MKKIKNLLGKTGALLAGLMLCFGMEVFAAPSVGGSTDLTAVTDEIVSADFTITSDGSMEEATLVISYDKDALTYMTGSGDNGFKGEGGNGTVQLTSAPGASTTSFTVKFKGKKDEDTELSIASCTITVDGQTINALTGEALEEGEDSGEEEEEEEEERASFVIDERTFYVRRPDELDGFDTVHLDIQGYDCRVLKHNSLDLYVVKLRSDNGSYRDNFVYNPETGNVIPYVQMESGNDTVIFIEPEEDMYVPTRYSPVNMGWGPKYTIPAFKHVIIDGVDEIPDDTNRYLIYGINQDGEKAWYSYDYDKNSLQLFDDYAYQGEQNYILALETMENGLREESAHQLERYNTDMGRRLTVIMIMTFIIIALLNVVGFLYFRMRKMQMVEPDEADDEDDDDDLIPSGEYVTGNLEENETNFRAPEEKDEDEIELEIIDLDDFDEDEDDD